MNYNNRNVLFLLKYYQITVQAALSCYYFLKKIGKQIKKISRESLTNQTQIMSIEYSFNNNENLQ